MRPAQGAIAVAALALAAGGCTSSSAPAAGGFDGAYCCLVTTVTPAGTTSGPGTFSCAGGHCADPGATFVGDVDGDGDFTGTTTVCPTCDPLPMSGRFSTTAHFTISGSSGSVSQTLDAWACGGVGGDPAAPSLSGFTPSRGVALSSLRIYGANIDTTYGYPVVYVCGVLADVNLASSSELRVTVPDLPAGSCTVEVETAGPGGVALTAPGAYQVVAATILVSDLSLLGADQLALDASTVYFTSLYGEFVGSVPKAGGTAKALATGLQGPDDLAVDSASVYWTERWSGKIRGCPIGGGAPVDLASGVGTYRIGIDAGHVYWAGDMAVWRVPKGGGDVERLTTTPAQGTEAVVDATHVYVAAGDAIRRVPVAGGDLTALATGLTAPRSLALGAGYVYFAEGDAVRRVPIAGGEVETLASGRDYPHALALDGANVWFATGASAEAGALERVPLGGGAVTTFLSGLYFVKDVAVDAASVFWADNRIRQKGK